MRRSGAGRRAAGRRRCDAARACGASPGACTWRCSTDATLWCSASTARTAAFRRSARCIRRRSGWSGRCAICTAWIRWTAGYASLARPRRWGEIPDPPHPTVPARRRRGPAPDPGRAGARRHHRARPFPLHRQRRDRGAAGAAAGLRAQGHRRLMHGATIAQAARLAGAHLGRQHRRLCAGLCARRRGGARHRAAAARCLAARRDGGAGAARQPPRRLRRDLQRRRLQHHAWRIAACCANACCAAPTRASATG